jgi:hypothetical protein
MTTSFSESPFKLESAIYDTDDKLVANGFAACVDLGIPIALAGLGTITSAVTGNDPVWGAAVGGILGLGFGLKATSVYCDLVL